LLVRSNHGGVAKVRLVADAQAEARPREEQAFVEDRDGQRLHSATSVVGACGRQRVRVQRNG
jgi:hypothetical protein